MNFLSTLAPLERSIAAFSEWTGRVFCWLFVAMVVVQIGVVVFRYVFGVGNPVANDSVLYMHAISFMTLVGYTLRHDAHVRVDVFYLSTADRVKGIIDLVGVIFFMWPMCAIIMWSAWPYVSNAWAIREGSSRVSGIQGAFVLKTFILVFAILLAIQGLAMALSALDRIFKTRSIADQV